MKVIIVSTQFGDWEGLYIDDKLIDDGHELGEGDGKHYMLKASEKYGFKLKNVKTCELNDEDEDTIADSGSFPKNYEELGEMELYDV